MRGVVMYAPGDVRVEDRPEPTILKPTDAVIRLSAAYICGSDLWPYIIAMSRHQPRQQLAREFGATDIVTERGDDGVAAIKDLTDGLGAHSVIEAVGSQESMMQAIHSTLAGGHVGYVGVAHEVALPAAGYRAMDERRAIKVLLHP